MLKVTNIRSAIILSVKKAINVKYILKVDLVPYEIKLKKNFSPFLPNTTNPSYFRNSMINRKGITTYSKLILDIFLGVHEIKLKVNPYKYYLLKLLV